MKMKMKKSYNVQIIESFYKDDYEDGEVLGTFSTVTLETKQTDDVKKAIADFAARYGDKDGKVFIDDDIIHMDFMKCPDDYGWRDPTDEEVEKWKKGEYELYNVEYQMRVWEMKPVEAEKLEKYVEEFVRE